MLKYLIDKIAFAAGLLLGLQVPHFIAAYRQRLGGRLDQALLDLQPFHEVANRFHQGSLDALIQHHLRSADASFHAEGTVLQELVAQVRRLAEAYQALNASLLEQLRYLVVHLDRGIAEATLDAYVPGLLFSVEALICAVVLAFLFSLIVHIVAALLRRIGARRDRHRFA